MTTVFHSGPAGAAFQSAFSLGLALAAMMFIVDWILITMQGQGWLLLLRIANSHGWHLIQFGGAENLVFFCLNSRCSISGDTAGFMLHETRRLKRYLLVGILSWEPRLLLSVS